MLRKIVTESATDAVSEQIIGMIKQGQLKPGDQLPSEFELKEQLGVSRSTLREAKRMLAAKGLIKVRLGQGTFVCELGPDALDADVIHILLRDATLLDLQECREMMETQIAAQAAARRTEAELLAMQTILAQLAEAETAEEVAKAGLDFHRCLVEMSHNAVCIKLYGIILNLLRVHQQPRYPNEKEHELSGHRELYACVKAGDAARAQDLMRKHLRDVRHMTFEAKVGGDASEPGTASPPGTQDRSDHRHFI